MKIAVLCFESHQRWNNWLHWKAALEMRADQTRSVWPFERSLTFAEIAQATQFFFPFFSLKAVGDILHS